MKIYLLDCDAENYRWLEYKNIFVDYNGHKVSLFDYFHAHLVNVESMNGFNEIIKCKTIRDKKERVLGDYPYFVLPAISQKAKEVLEKHLENLVEIFPLDVGKWGIYYFLNIMNVLDLLDTEKSIIRRLSSGKIIDIKKYTFDEKILSINSNLFQLQHASRSLIFVNEETKQLIESAGLEGFIFTQVWDSEDPDFVYEPKKIF